MSDDSRFSPRKEQLHCIHDSAGWFHIYPKTMPCDGSLTVWSVVNCHCSMSPKLVRFDVFRPTVHGNWRKPTVFKYVFFFKNWGCHFYFHRRLPLKSKRTMWLGSSFEFPLKQQNQTMLFSPQKNQQTHPKKSIFFSTPDVPSQTLALPANALQSKDWRKVWGQRELKVRIWEELGEAVVFPWC